MYWKFLWSDTVVLHPNYWFWQISPWLQYRYLQDQASCSDHVWKHCPLGLGRIPVITNFNCLIHYFIVFALDARLELVPHPGYVFLPDSNPRNVSTWATGNLRHIFVSWLIQAVFGQSNLLRMCGVETNLYLKWCLLRQHPGQRGLDDLRVKSLWKATCTFKNPIVSSMSRKAQQNIWSRWSAFWQCSVIAIAVHKILTHLFSPKLFLLSAIAAQKT